MTLLRCPRQMVHIVHVISDMVIVAVRIVFVIPLETVLPRTARRPARAALHREAIGHTAHRVEQARATITIARFNSCPAVIFHGVRTQVHRRALS